MHIAKFRTLPKYEAYSGYHPKIETEKNYYIFEYPQGREDFEEIKPYYAIGFMWV